MPNSHLKASTRNLLYKIKTSLKTQQWVRKTSNTQALQQLKAWCDYHDVDCGLQFSASELAFTADVLAKIEHALAQLKQLPLQETSKANDRINQAETAYEENKYIGAQPREYRVLCLQFAAQELFIDKDYRDIKLDNYSCLICVENLDVFYQFAQRHTLDTHPLLLKPLIIYRGDTIYSKGSAAIIQRFKQQQKPCLYFGDFDVAGLHIALSKGFSHLLLPEYDFLLQAADPAHFVSEQIALLPSILEFEQHLPVQHESKRLLSIITLQHKALKQQWFAQQLIIYALTLEDTHTLGTHYPLSMEQI